MDKITFEKQKDGSFIKTTIQLIIPEGKDYEANRLRELKGNLERRKTSDIDEQQQIKETINNYEEQLIILES